MKRNKTAIFFIGLTLVIALAAGVGAYLYFSNAAVGSSPEPETADSAAAIPAVVTLYDVDAVNSRTRRMTVTRTSTAEASQELAEALTGHNRLVKNSFLLDDIPVLEVHKRTLGRQPLVLFLHGLGQNKESLAPVLAAYAENGYYAVAIDAFNHGERLDAAKECDTWASALITVGDVDEIVEYYQGVRGVDADDFVIGGFSMGAVEAVAYTEIGSYTPAAVVALSGMCDTSAWLPRQGDTLTFSWLKRWKDSVWGFPDWQDRKYTSDKEASIVQLGATRNISALKNTPILCCVGTADRFFSAEGIGQIVKTLQNSGNENAFFISYTDGKHEITEEMVADSLLFLSEGL